MWLFEWDRRLLGKNNDLPIDSEISQRLLLRSFDQVDIEVSKEDGVLMLN